jgi:hypothetical protein
MCGNLFKFDRQDSPRIDITFTYSEYVTNLQFSEKVGSPFSGAPSPDLFVPCVIRENIQLFKLKFLMNEILSCFLF